MRILIISSFGMKDGIEAYTEELCNALKKCEVESIKCSITGGFLHLINRVVREKVSIVHIQHEYNLFKPRPFGITALIILALSRLFRKEAIVTLHTVYPIKDFENYIPSRYRRHSPVLKYLAKIAFLIVTKMLAKLSHYVIVLTLEGKRVLEVEYGVHNVSFIPYGIHRSRTHDHRYAKSELGFSDKVVLMCFGYPYPNKGYHYAIEAVGKLVERGYRNVVLLLQDEKLAHDYRKCGEYVNTLKELRKRLRLEPYVCFVSFIPENILPVYLSAVDIFIYPFEPRVASSSALMRTLYFGKWHILSDIPAFGFLKHLKLKNIKFIKPRSPDEIAKAILQLLSRSESLSIDKELLDKLAWENIGKMHIKLYNLVKC